MAMSSDHSNKQMNPGQCYDSGLGSLNQQPNAASSLDEKQIPQEVTTYDHEEIFHLESEDEQDVDPAYVSLESGDFSSLQLTSMPLMTTINELPPVVDPDVDTNPDIDTYPTADTTGNVLAIGQADMDNDTSSSSTTTMISTSQTTEVQRHSGALPNSPNEAEEIHDHGSTMNMLPPSTMLSNVTAQPIEIIIREQIAEGSDFDQERVLIELKVPSPQDYK